MKTPITVFAMLLLVVALSCASNSMEQSSPEQAPLFSDASNGIEQFVGGDTMPIGSYDFKCGLGGNVSVQLGTAPYTVSLQEGDQTRHINQGDLVTVGLCKVYGPQ